MERVSPAVLCEGVGRRFGRRWVLAHVDLAVERAETLLLAGANGSGKTTLLRILAGLSRPSAGGVRILGHDPHSERLTCRRSLSMVSHRSYLYDGLSALEMLRVWARLADRAFSDDALDALLEEVALSAHRDLPVGGYSAGMRKRLTLVRTRIENPDILLLDEPMAALDAAGKRLVERWIEREVERGTTVIVASHDIARMSRICSRGLLLEQGQVAWTGPAGRLPEELERSA